MSEVIKYISKIEIKGLWGRYDLEWNLNEDVNVLSGINGSGKSTILNCAYKLLTSNALQNYGNLETASEISKLITGCKIVLNNGNSIQFEFIKKDDKNGIEILEKESADQVGLNEYLKSVYFEERHYIFITQSRDLFNLFNEKNSFQIDFVSTFDIELKPSESIKKLSDDSGRTGLDWELYQLQKKYIKYKLALANKIIQAINKNDTNGTLVKIQENQNRFLEIIDTLFEQTGKKIERKEDEIAFLAGKEKISAYQLSSGEKQMLVILLTVLVQDNKNAILFMDEPELSLHFDWQRKLIQYIRALNPNVQIILATHSPALIIEGWMDKVANVSDLINPSHKSEANAGK